MTTMHLSNDSLCKEMQADYGGQEKGGLHL